MFYDNFLIKNLQHLVLQCDLEKIIEHTNACGQRQTPLEDCPSSGWGT